MGGIPTNYHAEVLAPTADDPDRVCPGLMAIGEAACVSVHGANRLGTNSLLDIVVFGRAAALRAAETITPGAPHKPLPKDAGENSIARLDAMRHAKGSLKVADVRDRLQRGMQKHAAVFRDEEILSEGVKVMAEIAESMSDIGINDRSLIWNTDLVEGMELENLVGQAMVTINSAHLRQESRGAHAREDFTERDDEKWMKHSCMWLDENYQNRVQYRDVQMNTLTDEVESFPPKARVY
jgi:succinate dehydrogenase / fumarate reductase flavoprotein subunit